MGCAGRAGESGGIDFIRECNSEELWSGGWHCIAVGVCYVDGCAGCAEGIRDHIARNCGTDKQDSLAGGLWSKTGHQTFGYIGFGNEVDWKTSIAGRSGGCLANGSDLDGCGIERDSENCSAIR
jgi:hypothetical protein